MPSGAATDRYLAVFEDGKRLFGERLFEWHDPRSQPRLDSTRLFVGGNKLRWMRDLSHNRKQRPPAAFVELLGGDRLPGEVVGFSPGAGLYRPGATGPPHLMVRPSTGYAFPGEPDLRTIRVVADVVRRIVWKADRHERPWRPQTLFFRDGRQVRYRSMRWESDGMRVLLEDGARTVRFDELVEIHFAARDSWRLHFRQLAVLAPAGDERLIRVETAGGLIATGSDARFVPAHHHGEHEPQRWYHMLQPAWSLDALWVHFPSIHTWKFFAPHEMPLSRLLPSGVWERSFLGRGWRWQVNRSVHGEPLQSGGQRHGWGLGVHALCELEFRLPPFARRFRTKIGLDHQSGGGGCVRAKILAGSVDREEQSLLFDSGFLIGSERGVDTGDLVLLPDPESGMTLTLLADPAHDERPTGADPLDIRDSLDWLEPLVTLDPQRVREETRRHKRAWIPAWEGWELISDGDDYRLQTLWHADHPEKEPVHLATVLANSSLVLQRSIEPPEEMRWLLVQAFRLDEEEAGRLEVLLDGEVVGQLKIPRDEPGQAPLAIALPDRDADELDFQLRLQPRRGPVRIVWESLSVADRLPTLVALVEDDIEPLAEQGGEGSARVGRDDPYTGSACLRLAAAEDASVRLAHLDFPIREKPAVGEFRYLRFAVRMTGRVRACWELQSDELQHHPLRYDAGVGPPARGEARRVLSSVPPQWVVITRDLFDDFGPFDLTGIELAALGDGQVWLDHVYLARSEEDFDLIGAHGGLSDDTAKRGALASFGDVLEEARAAFVRIQVERWSGSGVIVSEDGTVATTGYVAIAPGKKATVTLADGRQVAAEVRGIDRDVDAALVQLEGEGPWPHVPWSKDEVKDNHRRWLALAHVGSERPPRVGAALVRHHGGRDHSVWVSLEFRRAYSGGALIDRHGRLVGLLSRPYGPGGTLAVPGRTIYLERIKLSGARPRGTWPISVTPHLGLNAAGKDGRLVVIAVRKGGPADRGGIRVGDELTRFAGQPVSSVQELVEALGRQMPGDAVEVELQRDATPLKLSLTLGRRG